MAKTGRPREFDRTEALDAALRVFWQQGYEATSINQLTNAMGRLSTASFYATFRSKEALFREVVQRYLETYGEVLSPLYDASASPRVALRAALLSSAQMQTGSEHPTGCLVSLGASGWSAQNAELESLLANERRKNRQAIRTLMKRAAKAGTVGTTEANGLATLFDALLLGLAVQARDGVALDEIQEAIDAAFERWDCNN
jgi:AcrR family transcriptional regulator